MAHPRAAMSLRQLLVVALLFGVTAAVLPSAASAQSLRRTVLLAVTRLNSDCYPDTVLGILEMPSMHITPRRIRWGRAPLALADSSRSDSTQRDDTTHHTPDSLCRTVRETRFRYPQWEGFSCTVSFQPVNYDSLTDMVFYLRGGVLREGEEEARDSLRPLVLYGQSGLDTMRMIDLSSIPVSQSSPFFASELSFGVDFINQGQRDMSGGTSWEMERKDLDIEPADTTVQDSTDQRDSSDGEQPQITTTLAAMEVVPGSGRSPRVRISPNPSEEEMTVEVEQLPAGGWTMEVLGVNGAVYQQQEVVLAVAGRVQRRVDVRGLASGYYLLRVRNAEGTAGTYPIVVKR